MLQTEEIVCETSDLPPSVHCQLFKAAKSVMPSNLHTSLLFPLILSSNPLPLGGVQPKHALVTLVLHQLSVSADPADLIQRNDFWLPDDVVPVKYNLRLLVDMEEFTTEGEVKIRVEVKKATNQITLHVARKIVTVLEEKVKVYHNAKQIHIKKCFCCEEMSKTLSMLHLAPPQTQKSDKTKTFAQPPATLNSNFSCFNRKVETSDMRFIIPQIVFYIPGDLSITR